MYAIIYSFRTKPDRQESFLQSWKDLTNLIKVHAGSLGSRLHQVEENHFIAYAQWPDQKTFEASKDKLPDSCNSLRKEMRDACEGVEVLCQMEVVEDLIV